MRDKNRVSDTVYNLEEEGSVEGSSVVLLLPMTTGSDVRLRME